MIVIHSTCGRVFMLSEYFYTFSYASLNLVSMTFIYVSSTRLVQIYALSSEIFFHSSSILLIFSIIVIISLSLPDLSYSTMCDCKSSILVWNPLMNSLILEACSSMVDSTTNNTSKISLYNLWTNY
jgi:hypothetical protein